MKLRPYQEAACAAALDWLRKSTSPCLIDAAPAAGKSFMVAYLASQLHAISGGKRVLCLAPSAELVRQNYEKYLLTGERASIFSASAGAKSTRNFVVFGTPGTVKNSISRFCKTGQDGFCAVIVDEAHGMTPTIRDIIEEMRKANPNLRVIGLTGTPYRLGSGYIFRLWPDDRVNDDSKTRDPYFAKCVYRVSAQEMLEQGFITPMDLGAINTERYDTSGIVLLPNGTFNPETVERAFVGHGRLTASIVADAIHQAGGRRGGVMYFAATIQHAYEVLASLPPESSAIVTGDMATGERKDIIKRYRTQEIRHIVSVGTLTTGFDVSHTETIVLLRFTESAALLQQILGRAWRLHPGKDNSLLLDYAGNIEKHFPDGDIYNPEIKAGKIAGDGEGIEATCPDCGNINQFKLNPDYENFQRDDNGYCLDVFGERLMSEFGPIPAHYGRRCFGLVQTGPKGQYERCNHRWAGKPCPNCDEPNDIAARYCYSCKAEIVDPNEKLVADFKALKRDPHRPQCDEVISVTFTPGLSKRGAKTIRADWVTYYRHFSTWHMPNATHTQGMRDWAMFDGATNGGQDKPDTVKYMKDSASGFWRIMGYNGPCDVEPVKHEV